MARADPHTRRYPARGPSRLRCRHALPVFALAAILAALADASPPKPLAVRVKAADPGLRERLAAALPVLDHSRRTDGSFVVVTDEGGLLDLRRAGLDASVDGPLTQALSASRAALAGYLTSHEVEARLLDLAAARPGLAQLVDFGDSWCRQQGGCALPVAPRLAGHDLLALRVTNRARTGAKPVAFFVAGHHAREIHTTDVALRFAKWLLDSYDADADATWLVDHHDTWIVPLGNPDGYDIVWRGEIPLWQRKNANDLDSADWVECAWPPYAGRQSGVDLNRNFDFHWRAPRAGWMNDPCEDTYPGSLDAGPASQPEVSALASLVQALVADHKGGDGEPAPRDTPGVFVSIHSGGGAVLYPWDFQARPAPNQVDLAALWGKVVRVSPGWEACPTGPCLGPLAGTASDWAYGTLGVAAATFEIGDMMPVYERVESEYWPVAHAMMLYTLRVAGAPYRQPHGPDVRGLAVGPPVVCAGAPVLVRANLDAGEGREVLDAEAWLDTLPGGAGDPLPLGARDGSFDSPVEEVEVRLDSGRLAAGRHTVFVRGRTRRGEWGPPWATFFRVEGRCG